MDFLELASKRYSCRAYCDKPVEKNKLDNLAKLCQLSPSAKNNQPSRLYIVENSKVREELEEAFTFRYDCPVYLVVTGNSDIAWHHPISGEDSASVDASIVLTHLMLGAKDMGLDTCFLGNFDQKLACSTLGLEKNEKIYGILCLGYRDEENGTESVRHYERNDIDKLVKFI